MNCNRDGNRTLEEAFREEQALEGPENPERICWMDLEEVGKGRRSIVGVDGWVSNWDPGHWGLARPELNWGRGGWCCWQQVREEKWAGVRCQRVLHSLWSRVFGPNGVFMPIDCSESFPLEWKFLREETGFYFHICLCVCVLVFLRSLIQSKWHACWDVYFFCEYF